MCANLYRVAIEITKAVWFLCSGYFPLKMGKRKEHIRKEKYGACIEVYPTKPQGVWNLTLVFLNKGRK